MNGWPDDKKLGAEIKPYSSKKNKLSVLDGWASRVVVPPPGRQLVLDKLHSTHPGISKMKALAHAFMWWPGMDADIGAGEDMSHVPGIPTITCSRSSSPLGMAFTAMELHPCRPVPWSHVPDYCGHSLQMD